MSGEDQRGDRGKGQPSSNSVGNADPNVLAEHLGELARTLEHEHNLHSTLEAIVHAAVGTVPGATHASISAVLRRREVQTRAATSEVAFAVDKAQYETGEGPCLDTLYEQKTIRLADTAMESRWPRFSAAARELGVGAMLALQLYVEGGDLGALNLFNERAGAFDDDSEHVGLLFATHAAVAMAGAQQREQLRLGMSRRDVIGQAKGILMERYKINADQAFQLLIRLSQNSNRKLHELAEEVVGAGELATIPPTDAGRRK